MWVFLIFFIRFFLYLHSTSNTEVTFLYNYETVIILMYERERMGM